MRVWFVLLVLASAASAKDPITRFEELKANYNEVAREATGWIKRKTKVVNGLAALDLPEARALLMRIVRTDRAYDVKLAGVRALARTAELATIRDLATYLKSKKDPVLILGLGEGLGASARADVRTWVSTEALAREKSPILDACLTAAGALGRPDAIPAIAAAYETSARHTGTVDTACRAIGALGALADPRGLPTLIAAAQHDDWRIRRAAAAALPGVGRADAKRAAAVNALFGDSSSTVKRTLAVACGAARAEEFVLPLVGLVEDAPRLRTRHAASQALKRITAQDFGLDGNRWRRWIKHKDAGAERTRRTFAKYYGFSVYSDRVVFIVDVSGSMRRPEWTKPTRIDVARQQLVTVLGGLDPQTLFNIIVFSTKSRAWQAREIEATPANVEKAIAWLTKKMKPDGDTHTYDALERAFTKNPAFDTIYLLSDGNPSDGRYWRPDGILASVRHWNRHRAATIHTIALTLTQFMAPRYYKHEKPREMAAFLKELATSTGGSSTHVQQPPK